MAYCQLPQKKSPALWLPDRAESTAAFLERVRALPGADRIALCAPRLLVRIPYGRASDPVDRFSFEEVDEDTDSDGYTWGGAFFADNGGRTLTFEHEVYTLGEPRPTSIDVLLSGSDRRVAVECKFTEA